MKDIKNPVLTSIKTGLFKAADMPDIMQSSDSLTYASSDESESG